MLDHIISALSSLAANKVRTALTMLGVVIGVLAVTLLVGVGDGARAYLERTLTDVGSNLLNVIPGRRETRSGGLAPVTGAIAKPLTMDDVRLLERQSTLLRGVCGLLLGTGPMRFAGRQRDTTIVGVQPSFSELRNIHVDRGSFLRDEDVAAHRRVAIVGRTVVREVFGDENPLGQSIRLADGRFRVIGLLEEKGRSLGFDLDDVVLVPVTAAEDLFGQDSLSQILTAARTPADARAASDEVEELLARRRNGEKAFTIQSQDDLIQTFATLTNAMTLMLLAIASISLVVGGIGIMNIMLVSVRERTREIGVRRAVGATRMDILWQFLLESIVIAALGGVLGLTLGVVVVAVVKKYAPEVPVVLSPPVAVVAFASSFIVGVISGVAPARRAARLDPVEALRYE